jgi:TonB family protein
MRSIGFLALILAATLSGFSQTPASAGPGLPKDPRAIFAAADPFYDFTSPDLKPWHLKANYQLYDEKGNPSEQGTFEYWWASPKVYRSTWTRPSATHTDWNLTEDSFAHLSTGERLGYFEEMLKTDLLSPLPAPTDLDPTKVSLYREDIGSKGSKIPCIMLYPLQVKRLQMQTERLGFYPSYCFDPQLPILRGTYNFNTLTKGFSHIVSFQNRYLAREIHIAEGDRKILSASVDAITDLASSDPALMPPPEAHFVKVNKLQVGASVMVGMLLKKEIPVYPEEAKNSHISGTVVLQATVGKDGKIKDLRVILSPSPSLSKAAMDAVSQWGYRPYLENGEPTEVQTTVNVIFSLGG